MSSTVYDLNCRLSVNIPPFSVSLAATGRNLFNENVLFWKDRWEKQEMKKYRYSIDKDKRFNGNYFRQFFL